MKSVVVLTLLLFSQTIIYSFSINGNISNYHRLLYNFLRLESNNIFNLFDNNANTFLVLDNYYNPSINIVFNDYIEANQFLLFQYKSINKDSPTVTNSFLLISNHLVIYSNITVFLDTGMADIELPNYMKFNEICVQYINGKKTYSSYGLSELKIRKNGLWLTCSNIDNALKDLKSSYLDGRTKYFRETFGYGRLYGCTDIDKIMSDWEIPDEFRNSIYYKYENNLYLIPLEFYTENPYQSEGLLLTVKKNETVKLGIDNKVRLNLSAVLGYWKFDEWGQLWIMIGNKGWKCAGHNFDLNKTDLGTFVVISDIK